MCSSLVVISSVKSLFLDNMLSNESRTNPQSSTEWEWEKNGCATAGKKWLKANKRLQSMYLKEKHYQCIIIIFNIAAVRVNLFFLPNWKQLQYMQTSCNCTWTTWLPAPTFTVWSTQQLWKGYFIVEWHELIKGLQTRFGSCWWSSQGEIFWVLF